MSTCIRLARRGKKNSAFYHIVVAETTSPRDGRFIEKIGYYNPVRNPEQIELDTDKALRWMDNGARPSETVRTIFSRAGVLYKRHLLRGVKLGKVTAEEADVKYRKFLTDLLAKTEMKRKKITDVIKEKTEKINEEEKKIRKKKFEKIMEKKAAEDKARVENALSETGTGETPEATPVQEPGSEEPSKDIQG
ncbi:MAG: 30S ribosomal protein S16 [Bacteroidetes bacterium]|nr:30S ribosomal protein S16 [Bacteroidota bacterium]